MAKSSPDVCDTPEFGVHDAYAPGGSNPPEFVPASPAWYHFRLGYVMAAITSSDYDLYDSIFDIHARLYSGRTDGLEPTVDANGHPAIVIPGDGAFQFLMVVQNLSNDPHGTPESRASARRILHESARHFGLTVKASA